MKSVNTVKAVKATVFPATLIVTVAAIFTLSCGGASTAVKTTPDSDNAGKRESLQQEETPVKTPSNPNAQILLKNVAVIEPEVDASSVELAPAEVGVITAELRKEAVKNLPRDRYNVMTSETVSAQGSGSVLIDCAEENCVIALGSKIGADYITRGIISKFRNKITLTVEIYDTEDGNLVASSGTVLSENIEELWGNASAPLAEMYKTFLNRQGVAAPEPQAPVPQAEDAGEFFTDSRDGKKYKTVATAGGKRWMAENLNYRTPSGSWCYDDDDSNCEKYGRLYDWNTAMKVCPAGWHLSSRAEWDNFVNIAGGKKAGKNLSAASGWDSKGNGSDDFGFSALPGGHRYLGGFRDAGSDGHWWTDTESHGGRAFFRSINRSRDDVEENDVVKNSGFSARCVSDF